MRIKRLILLLAIIVVVILLYKSPFNEKTVSLNESSNEEKSVNTANTTAFGDMLTINYVLKIKESGEVIDTNDPVLIKEYNIRNYVKGTYKFILGNSDKLRLKSFDNALIGWKVGEKKSVEIEPTEEKLFIKKERTETKNLYFAIPRYQRLSLKKFQKLFNTEPAIGEIVTNSGFPWSFKIINITENSAVGDPIIEVGKTYIIPKNPWPVEVTTIQERVIQFKHAPDEAIFETIFGKTNVTIDENKLIVYYNPKKGEIVDYDISLGPVQIPAKLEILEVTQEDFLLQRIDNINDKLLILDAEILDRIPDIKFVRNESLVEKKTKQTFGYS